MFLLIAQGGGFYGCAIWTCESALFDIAKAMQELGMTLTSNHPNGLNGYHKESDTSITVKKMAEDSQLRCPKPEILIDGELDVVTDKAILEMIETQLKTIS